MVNLEYGLLVPRKPMKFRIVEGSYETANGALPPLVRTSYNHHDFEGFESGRRSGIIKKDKSIFRIKGCEIEQAFRRNDLYKRTRDTFGGQGFDPYGGMLLPDAQNELKWLRVYNEILAKEGFPACNEPHGIINYGRRFKRDTLTDLIIPEFLLGAFGLPKSEGQLAASVMKIRGDTRLPEIYVQDVQNIEGASAVAYGLGLLAGAHKRIT